MRSHVIVLAALLGVASSDLAAQDLPACRLLIAKEVATFLGVAAVKIDSVNSGTNVVSKAELYSWTR